MSDPNQARDTMIANIPEKTGKTLKQWITILKKQSLEKHGFIVKYLKTEHQVTHGFANLIAHMYQNEGTTPVAETKNDDALIAAQYAGKKAALRPIYDTLMKHILKFGKDVEVAPKKAYVSLRRSKQFAIIQPSTQTRLDVGLKLPGKAPTKRLESSGSFNSMVTHRVRITDAKDVDKQLLGWLKTAYEKA